MKILDAFDHEVGTLLGLDPPLEPEDMLVVVLTRVSDDVLSLREVRVNKATGGSYTDVAFVSPDGGGHVEPEKEYTVVLDEPAEEEA